MRRHVTALIHHTFWTNHHTHLASKDHEPWKICVGINSNPFKLFFYPRGYIANMVSISFLSQLSPKMPVYERPSRCECHAKCLQHKKIVSVCFFVPSLTTSGLPPEVVLLAISVWAVWCVLPWWLPSHGRCTRQQVCLCRNFVR